VCECRSDVAAHGCVQLRVALGHQVVVIAVWNGHKFIEVSFPKGSGEDLES